MATELATRQHNAKQPAILTFSDADPFFERMQELYEAVARRAYNLFEERGHEHGCDLRDWLMAESELLNRLPVEISETNEELVVRAEMPGFREKEIEVRVEPHRLVISGSREQMVEEKKRRTLYSERRSSEALRIVDLPEDVNPDKARATLEEGTLEIVLPKARPARRVPVSAKAA